MVSKIYLLVIVTRYVFSFNLSISTLDTGHIYSTNTKDIVKYYKPLSTYGIIPTAKQSLNFYLKACAHAYVLLSASDDITKAREFYEIVIGGSGNKWNKVRRRYKGGEDRGLKDIGAISLHCDKYMKFSLDWTTDGTLTFSGKTAEEGYEIVDSQPIHINAFGIRTGFGNNGSWLFESKDNKSLCRCPCGKSFWFTNNNSTRDELLEKLYPQLQAIKQELTINKYNLSINRRRRTSAPDDRKSAKQIGIVGIIFLSVVIGLVVLIDITALCR